MMSSKLLEVDAGVPPPASAVTEGDAVTLSAMTADNGVPLDTHAASRGGEAAIAADGGAPVTAGREDDRPELDDPSVAFLSAGDGDGKVSLRCRGCF